MDVVLGEMVAEQLFIMGLPQDTDISLEQNRAYQ